MPDSQLSSDFRLQRREFFHPNSSFLRKLVLICTSLERVISWVTDSDFRSIFEILLVLRQSSVRNHVKVCFLGLIPISNSSAGGDLNDEYAMLILKKLLGLFMITNWWIWYLNYLFLYVFIYFLVINSDFLGWLKDALSGGSSTKQLLSRKQLLRNGSYN